MIVGNRLHEHDFRTDIFCDLFDLEFPEMGCLNLDLSAGHSDNAVLGRFDALPDFLALTHINLHGLFLHANTVSAAHESYVPDNYQLWYTNWFTWTYTFSW